MKTISVIQELMLCWCPLRNYGMVRPFRMSLAGEWRRKDQKKGIRTRTQKWQRADWKEGPTPPKI